jgi:hypothetical protein
MSREVYREVIGPFGVVRKFLWVIQTDERAVSNHPGCDEREYPLSAALYIDDVEVDGEISEPELWAVWAAHLKEREEIEA